MFRKCSWYHKHRANLKVASSRNAKILTVFNFVSNAFNLFLLLLPLQPQEILFYSSAEFFKSADIDAYNSYRVLRIYIYHIICIRLYRYNIVVLSSVHRFINWIICVEKVYFSYPFEVELLTAKVIPCNEII